MKPAPRIRALLLAAGCLLVALAACSQYQPIDTEALLRQELSTRMGATSATQAAVPFALGDGLSKLLDDNLKPGGSERQRVNQVLELIFTRLKLQYALTPTRDAEGTFEARSGNCLSFVNLFVAVARQHRLNPFYVEVTDYQRWNYRDGLVVSRGHIVAGMYVSGKLETYDFLPYRAKAYRDFKPIDDVTATAHFYNNLGAEALLEGNLDNAREYLEIVHRIAPSFVKGLNNLGVIAARQGQIETALAIYERGLAKEPEDVALLTNLARAYQQLGRLAEAQQTLSRVAGINSTNPFFFIYQSELALARNQPQEALGYLAEALRRESEIPEIHSALVKAYMATGELQKARHHLGRALRLDATNREALKLAAMLGEPTPTGVRPTLDVEVEAPRRPE